MVQQKRDAGPFRDLYRYNACKAPLLAAHIFGATRSKLGATLSSCIGAREWGRIVSAGIVPTDYPNADTFSRDYLCAELMSKYPLWDLGIDRAKVALSKFREAESACLETNQRLRNLGSSSSSAVTPEAVMMAASQRIGRILPPFSWDLVIPHLSWGPGASTRLRRVHKDAYYKYAGIPHVTPHLADLAAQVIRHTPSWGVEELRVREHSKIVTVPKNAKTDRVIAVEPDMNMYFQLGLGAVIRKALQQVGLLYPNSQEINQSLAREGSITNRLATIDLSSASDMISYNLVLDLLPFDWFCALEQCRTAKGVLPSGEVLDFQKFSSMGNGATFELETLIFWGIVSAVVDLYGASDRRVLVYGDDIIVSTEVAHHVIDFLRVFGFSPNLKKSFTDGPFRESCGKHYFHGTDVTPFYVRKPIDSVTRWYWAANAVKRHSRSPIWGLDSTYEPVYNWIVSEIPRDLRLLIPEGVGDGGLVVDFDEACPSRAPLGHEGWQYRHVVEQSKTWLPSGPSLLTKALDRNERNRRSYFPYRSLDLSPGGRSEGASESMLGIPKASRLRVVTSIARQWPSYGTWL